MPLEDVRQRARPYMYNRRCSSCVCLLNTGPLFLRLRWANFQFPFATTCWGQKEGQGFGAHQVGCKSTRLLRQASWSGRVDCRCLFCTGIIVSDRRRHDSPHNLLLAAVGPLSYTKFGSICYLWKYHYIRVTIYFDIVHRSRAETKSGHKPDIAQDSTTQQCGVNMGTSYTPR